MTWHSSLNILLHTFSWQKLHLKYLTGFWICIQSLLEMFFSFTFGFQEIKRAVTKIALRDLRWLQNFNHPLVKLIVICKTCNKEIDTFSPTNWKVHYKFHGQKGYKCHQCGKRYHQALHYRLHMDRHKVIQCYR